MNNRTLTYQRDLYRLLSKNNAASFGYVPLLSERQEDIPDPVHSFIDRHCKTLNIPKLAFDPEVTSALAETSLPGNVRQLENIRRQDIVRACKYDSLIVILESD